MAPEPPAPDAYGGELVESGSFKVDRERALAKLNSFRDPGAGPILFWTRCAAACGASRMRVEGRADIELRFDGRPLAPWALRDPFEALFDTPKGAEAERFLALGLLHAMRPSVARVSVASGSGADRLRATIAGIASSWEPDDSGERDTVLRVELASLDPGLWLHPISKSILVSRPFSQFWPPFAMERYEKGKLLGRALPPNAAPCELVAEEDGVRAHLTVPHGLSSRSAIDLHSYGVLVKSGELDTGHPAVLGKVDDPGLTLNVSQTGVVADQRLDWLTRELLPRLALRLADKAGQDLRAGLQRLQPLLRERDYLRDLWARRVAEGPEAEARCMRGEFLASDARGYLADGSSLRDNQLSVLRAACVMLWLRNACMRLIEDGRPLPEALLRAPIFLGSDLGPVTLEEVRRRGDSPNVWRESHDESRRLARLIRQSA